MTDKIKTFLTLFAITAIIIITLVLLTRKAEKSEAEYLSEFNKGYNQTKGIITDIHYYKGRTLTVEYFINNKVYESTMGWDINPKHLDSGDSIYLKYAITNPQIIFTELNKDYYSR